MIEKFYQTIESAVKSLVSMCICKKDAETISKASII